MAIVDMPNVDIVVSTEGVLSNVQLTKPININFSNPSQFPAAPDQFKALGIEFQSASNQQMKADLAQYYTILTKIMSGTATPDDQANLVTITTRIKEYVLTDDDYNLMVGAIQGLQTYFLNNFNQDTITRATAVDTELNKMITTLNNFMIELESIYSQSPLDYPIPDKSVLTRKLEQTVQDTLAYTNASESVIVSNTKPANPANKKFIWFNTGNFIV